MSFSDALNEVLEKYEETILSQLRILSLVYDPADLLVIKDYEKPLSVKPVSKIELRHSEQTVFITYIVLKSDLADWLKDLENDE